MTDVVLTQAQFDALKAVCERANELVTTLPYISMMGGNVTRQNMTVQALATALEAVKVVDFENVRQLATGGFVTSNGMAFDATSSKFLPGTNIPNYVIAADIKNAITAMVTDDDQNRNITPSSKARLKAVKKR